MLTYERWQLDVNDIKGKIDRGELKPDPDWQRGYIWKTKDEQLLIDSILRKMPIPKFYLTVDYNKEKKANIYLAIDGQQRLTAIHRFLSNRFSIEINEEELYFRDLDTRQQEIITTYVLDGHYLKNYTQQDINFGNYPLSLRTESDWENILLLLYSTI